MLPKLVIGMPQLPGKSATASGRQALTGAAARQAARQATRKVKVRTSRKLAGKVATKRKVQA